MKQSFSKIQSFKNFPLYIFLGWYLPIQPVLNHKHVHAALLHQLSSLLQQCSTMKGIRLISPSMIKIKWPLNACLQHLILQEIQVLLFKCWHLPEILHYLLTVTSGLRWIKFPTCSFVIGWTCLYCIVTMRKTSVDCYSLCTDSSQLQDIWHFNERFEQIYLLYAWVFIL